MNLGAFLLFAISSRCLPLATRKEFESTNTHEFPVLTDLVAYIKGRVAMLEAVGFCGGFRRPVTLQDKANSLACQSDQKPKASFLTSQPLTSLSPKCVFCSGEHSLVKCPNFVNLLLDDHCVFARDKKLFCCLSSNHWASRFKKSKPCNKCTGYHHTLLVKDSGPSKAVPFIDEGSLVGSLEQHTGVRNGISACTWPVWMHARCMGTDLIWRPPN